MSHWRRRIGDKLNLLLAETLRVVDSTGALKKSDLARVTVDTTVQPKNITFPTDARSSIPGTPRKPNASAKARHAPPMSSAARSLSPPHIDAVPRGSSSFIHTKALHGNAYDGHTLGPVLRETEALTGREIERAYADKGYRGHNADKPNRIYKSGQKRGGQIKRELRRRSAVEPVIGPLKSDGHLGWNFLKGHEGDQINAVLSSVGHNLRLILKWLKLLCAKIILRIAALIEYKLSQIQLINGRLSIINTEYTKHWIKKYLMSIFNIIKSRVQICLIQYKILQ